MTPEDFFQIEFTAIFKKYDKAVLSFIETANVLGLSEREFRKRIAKNDCPAYQKRPHQGFGNFKYRFHIADIIQYLYKNKHYLDRKNESQES